MVRNGGKTLAEVRSLAMGAARSKARAIGMKPEECSADDMLAILDDIAREHGTKNWASKWYLEASETQIKLFRKEWKQWIREQMEMS